VSAECLKRLGEGMLCFARNPQGTPRRGKQQRLPLPAESTTVELMEVNQLNERLKHDSLKHCYDSAEQVLREWKLLGVIKSEVAPARSYGEDAMSRTLNLIVQGRVPTFNLWGGTVHAGSDLYFLVRKRARKAGEEPVWTITPWCSRNGERPSLRLLLNEKSGVKGSKHEFDGTLGEWLYVGKAGESILDGTPASQPTFDDTFKAKKLVRYLQLHIRV
jgi:hypothetical protein